MSVRTFLLGAVGCLLFAVSVAAQSPSELVERGRAAGADVELLEELRRRAGESGLSEGETVDLLEPAVVMAESGLPSRMVLQKGLEGLSKRVAPRRIGGVLNELRSAVERAGRLVDPWLGEPGVQEALRPEPRGGLGMDAPLRRTLVESVGLALFRGAPDGLLRSFLDRIPEGLSVPEVPPIRVAVGIEILPDVPLAAQEPGIAAGLVLEAVNSGFSAAELRELPAALRAAERRGQLPAEAVARGALAQMRGEVPAAAVLENLFRGEFPGNPPFDLPPGLQNAQERGKGGGTP